MDYEMRLSFPLTECFFRDEVRNYLGRVYMGGLLLGLLVP